MIRTRHQKNSLFLLLGLCLLACQPVPASPFNARANQNPSLISILNTERKPITALKLKYRAEAFSANQTPLSANWNTTTTDQAGQFKANCSQACALEIQAEGYWEFSGSYKDAPLIVLAPVNAQEKMGHLRSLSDFKQASFRLTAATELPAPLKAKDQGQVVLKIESEQELQPLVEAVKAMPAKDWIEKPSTAAWQQVLASGQRLVIYSNLNYLRTRAQLQELHETDDSYIFSANRSYTLSTEVAAGHSYDTEFLSFALPKDGKKIVFYTSAGQVNL